MTQVFPQRTGQSTPQRTETTRDAPRLRDGLRLPLGTLVGFAELLSTRDFPPDEQREMVVIMLREAQRLTTALGDHLRWLEGAAGPAAASPGAASPGTVPPSAAATDGSSEPASLPMVLLVEDEASTRALTGLMLRRLGLDYEAVENGREALDLLRADPARYGLVVLDLTLPDVDGLSVLNELRHVTATRDLPVLVFTGRNLTREERAFFARQSVQVIEKGTGQDIGAGVVRAMRQGVPRRHAAQATGTSRVKES